MYPQLTFTMTTFNRYRLFQKTLDSFLSMCLDKDLISSWIISDDGSSEEDLQKMQNNYPFLQIYRNPGKGQASNLNNLFSKVETLWFFHCEDDWLFRVKDNFLRKAMDIALENEDIKNITLRHWIGGEERKTANGMRFNVHVYNPDALQREICKTDAWWCGYTLNPGIQNKMTVDLLGKYDEKFPIDRRQWDREQARMYFHLGLKRANLLGNYIEHIGEEKSAYKLRGSPF